jgi:hypothetical protein
MEMGLSLEAAGRSASQEFNKILWNPKVHFSLTHSVMDLKSLQR